jgi:hypothetical protein
MQQLHPELKPYREFFLPVSHGHSLYIELCGNPHSGGGYARRSGRGLRALITPFFRPQ